MLSDELIERVRTRADDPKLRNDLPHLPPFESERFNLNLGKFAAKFECGLGPSAPQLAKQQKVSRLPNPVSADDIERAQKTLGFPLPDDLKQLLTEVADGGFGPGSGLAMLQEAIEYYQHLIEDPKRELGQTWPPQLFPFNFWDLGADCYDLNTGEIVFWDEELLAERPTETEWKNSFSKRTDTLSAYLENWLSQPDGGDSGFDAEVQEILNTVDTAVIEGVDAARLLMLLNSIKAMSDATPEELAVWGLPKENWEEALCKLQGLDPKIYLKLIRRTLRDPKSNQGS